MHNFPGALDTGTNLNNTRAINDDVAPADHNDVVNALIAAETKIGYGASVPTTVGNVLTVTGSGQTAWQTPAAGGGGGGGGTATFFNVKDYGALGNGSHDDTSAIQSAINAALATSRGTAAVYLPAGTYKITSKLNCSSATVSAAGKGVFLVGDGREASQIFRGTSGIIMAEWLGNQGPTHPNQFGGIRNITFNGNAQSGAAIHVVAGQQMEFFASSVVGVNDVAMDLDTCQDSYFYDLTFNNCGSTTKRVIEMYGSAYGTTNMMWFTQIRIETFYKGAVYIYRGAGATGGGNNGFFWSQCKFENYPTVRGDIFVADSWTQQLNMSQIFISYGQYDSGYATPANAILFGDGGGTAPGNNQASFRDIFVNGAPTSGICASAIKIDAGGVMDGAVVIENVDSTSTTTNGLIHLAGCANLDVDVRNLITPGTKYSGDGTGHSRMSGSGTLASGTATITTTRVRSSGMVFLTRTSSGAGVLSVGTITDGTSFVVNSSNGSDTGTFNWFVRN